MQQLQEQVHLLIAGHLLQQLVNALMEDPTTVNLTTSTVFTLTATSTTTSCSNTDAVTISISGGALNSTPTAAPGIVCAGENVQLHAMASGGTGSYTYTWTSAPVGFTSSIANPVTNPEVNTTYNVAVFDGFYTVNSQVAVTVNALPATPTHFSQRPNNFLCRGKCNLNLKCRNKLHMVECSHYRKYKYYYNRKLYCQNN